MLLFPVLLTSSNLYLVNPSLMYLMTIFFFFAESKPLNNSVDHALLNNSSASSNSFPSSAVSAAVDSLSCQIPPAPSPALAGGVLPHSSGTTLINNNSTPNSNSTSVVGSSKPELMMNGPSNAGGASMPKVSDTLP